MVRTPVENQSLPLDEGISKRTDSSLPLWVVLLGNVMSPLILKVRCTDVRIRNKNISRRAYFHR